MEGEGDARGQAARRCVVARLEQSIGFLCRGEDIQSALDELRHAMNTTQPTDTRRVKKAAQKLRDQLKLISELTDILEKIDPHSIDENHLKVLFEKSPTELVKDALIEGKLRERRIIIEAKEAEISRREAETNRKLLRWASIAAIAGVVASLGAVAAVLVAVLIPSLQATGHWLEPADPNPPTAIWRVIQAVA